jgi:8-oxo-dGTP pyrophosphatase MutT (NUDIX family)
MEKQNALDGEIIRKKLAAVEIHKIESFYLKSSSVLILLYPSGSTFKIIMTARSSKLNSHTGEMSFPGGRFDPNLDKTLKMTALRETYEEIGVPHTSIEILGRLDDLPTMTGYIIRPFVGLIQKDNWRGFTINKEEVENLVKIPIDFLTRENLFKETQFKAFSETVLPLLSFDFNDSELNKTYHIWGASAHLLAEFLKKVYNIQVFSQNYQRPSISEITTFIKKKKGKSKIKKLSH